MMCCVWTLQLKINCIGRRWGPLQAVLCAAPIKAHPLAALPVLIAQLHEPEAILHAPDWLLLHTRYEYSVAALPYLEILVLWFQQVLQGQLCLMLFSMLCLVVADCLRLSKLKVSDLNELHVDLDIAHDHVVHMGGISCNLCKYVCCCSRHHAYVVSRLDTAERVGLAGSSLHTGHC